MRFIFSSSEFLSDKRSFLNLIRCSIIFGSNFFIASLSLRHNRHLKSSISDTLTPDCTFLIVLASAAHKIWNHWPHLSQVFRFSLTWLFAQMHHSFLINFSLSSSESDSSSELLQPPTSGLNGKSSSLSLLNKLELFSAIFSFETDLLIEALAHFSEDTRASLVLSIKFSLDKEVLTREIIFFIGRRLKIGKLKDWNFWLRKPPLEYKDFCHDFETALFGDFWTICFVLLSAVFGSLRPSRTKQCNPHLTGSFFSPWIRPLASANHYQPNDKNRY
ncbi:hypothetical protein BpHYR1_050324 [Brachionus plicatilis]|uniref:Uncharacterized protein n=1 Tax=Brachionus plicatilis TaxID=10195 RepID=A0A3M7SCL9_BRAPC|nr:hypothetical protein BpHYR1_050324 [Brachionus plicatilis]